jgi:hypothetical protein
MSYRRVRFVPAVDYMAMRIVPSAAVAAVSDATVPSIAPDSSDDGSDSMTDPGYGDVDTSGQDASLGGAMGGGSDGSDGSGGAGTGVGTNGGGGLIDDSLDNLYSDPSSDDSGIDPMAPQLPDESEYTVATPVDSVSAF